MKIYLDLIFVLDFLFDLLLIISLAILLNRHTTLKRILIATLFGSIAIFVLFLFKNSIIIILCKLLISFVMVIIAFGYRDLVYSFRNMFYLYTLSIFLGGFLYLINIEVGYNNSGLLFYNNGLKINFIFLLILSPIVIYFYVKQVKLLKNNYSNYYNVDIYFDDNTVTSLIAFMDTGNNLYDPYKKRPIILVDKSKIKFDYNKNNILLVPYDTLNSEGLLKCIIPKKIYINNVGIKTNFLVGISEEKINIDGVDCILHQKLLEKGELL